jgi:transcriptional regulator with XRE-family HTH domain
MRRGPRGSGLNVDPLRARQARLEAGLSLAQVAGDDVSRTFIHLVEQGRSRPSIAVLRLIARRTGKPLTYFLRESQLDREAKSDLADELTHVAGSARRFAAGKQLTEAEEEGMRLLHSALQHGARYVRAVEQRTTQGAMRSRTHQEKAV